MFDITAISQLNGFLAQWIEAEGREVKYLQRFNKSNNPYGNCTRCLDEHEKQITDNDCPICYGTGYTRGYGPLVTGPNSRYQRTYGIFTKGTLNTDVQKAGFILGQQTQLLYIKMDQDPALYDLIVDSTGTRYRVGNEIDNWSFNGQQIGYIITVFQMSITDTLYKVPIETAHFQGVPSKNSLVQIKVFNPYQVVTNVRNYG